MSQKIFERFKEANPDGNMLLETFPGAGHGISFMEDEVRYGRIIDKAIALMEERSRHD